MILVNDSLPDDAPLVVLLHGYGADDRDLTGLVPYLPKEFRYASLRAPQRGPGGTGFQWFPLRFRPDGMSLDTSAEAVAGISADAVTAAEGVWAELDGLPAAPRAMVGFSQGAITGMQAWRLRPDGFVCGAVLSGYVAVGELPGDAEFARRRPPVFWGRGLQDAVIPVPAIAATTPWLAEHATVTEHIEPYAGHEVTLAELQALSAFLREYLGGAEG